MYLDTHQHFWKYDPIRYAWIDYQMTSLQRDFLPADLKPVLEENGVAGCVAVQADQTEAETEFLLHLADVNDFIRGVVGWVDLRASDVESRLHHFAKNPKLRGVRHIVQGEPDVNFLLRDDFMRGLRTLKPFHLTYDILVFPHQLGAALELVRRLPDQLFVIDHIAKPYIKDGFIDGWSVLIKEIAQHPNVYCKVSGMITEADWRRWTYNNFIPYLDVVFSAFGADRLMFGSDWPVCLNAGTYKQMINLVQQYTKTLTPTEQANFWTQTATTFYSLPPPPPPQ